MICSPRASHKYLISKIVSWQKSLPYWLKHWKVPNKLFQFSDTKTQPGFIDFWSVSVQKLE
jgi:hypothetical protein